MDIKIHNRNKNDLDRGIVDIKLFGEELQAFLLCNSFKHNGKDYSIINKIYKNNNAQSSIEIFTREIVNEHITTNNDTPKDTDLLYTVEDIQTIFRCCKKRSV